MFLTKLEKIFRQNGQENKETQPILCFSPKKTTIPTDAFQSMGMVEWKI